MMEVGTKPTGEDFADIDKISLKTFARVTTDKVIKNAVHQN